MKSSKSVKRNLYKNTRKRKTFKQRNKGGKGDTPEIKIKKEIRFKPVTTKDILIIPRNEETVKMNEANMLKDELIKNKKFDYKSDETEIENFRIQKDDIMKEIENINNTNMEPKEKIEKLLDLHMTNLELESKIKNLEKKISLKKYYLENPLKILKIKYKIREEDARKELLKENANEGELSPVSRNTRDNSKINTNL